MGIQQIGNNGGVIVTGKAGISIVRLLSFKGRVHLESKGMKSRGGSIRKLVCNELGLKPGTKHDKVIEAIEERIKELKVEMNAEPA